MGSRAVERGPAGVAISANVRGVRERRRLTQQELAHRLSDLGRPVQASAIAKIESGDRRVDVDDLVALAVALNVPPARLLLPDVEDDEDVNVVPAFPVGMWMAWGWATGRHPLYPNDTSMVNNKDAARQRLDYLAERPLHQRLRDEHPLVRAAEHLLWTVHRTVMALPGADQGADRPPAKGLAAMPWLHKVKGALDAVRDEAKRVQEQLADEGQPQQETTRG